MESSKVAPSAIVLELLNLDNYDHWSRRVKTYLLAEGLWKVVIDPDPKPEDDAWSRQNAKALHVIHISCGSVIFSLISDFSATENAREAWNMLAGKFNLDNFIFVHTDEKSNSTASVDGGRRSHEENVEIKVEATDGHENNRDNVALQEPYAAFFTRIRNRDIEAGEVRRFLRHHREAVKIQDPKTGHTGLHMAVSIRDEQMVRWLLSYMKKEDLEIKDKDDRTAFCYSVLTNCIRIVECLVKKNRALVSTPITIPPYKNAIPVALAVSYGNWEVASFLYNVTPLEDLKPEKGPSGADIITTCILKNKFDIAYDLISRCPKLAITEDFSGIYPLNLLAGMRSAFLSGTPLTFWQRWIYDRIRIHDDLTSFPEISIDERLSHIQLPSRISDIQLVNELSDTENLELDGMAQHDIQGSIISSNRVVSTIRPRIINKAMGRQVKLPFWQHIRTHCNANGSFFQEIFMALLKLLGIFERIYEKKLVHVRVLQLLNCMSKVTICDDIRLLHDSVVQRAIFQAVQHGHVEFVTVLVTQNPNPDPNSNAAAVDICDKRGRNFFKFAVECRQEKVYNLIHECEAEFIDRMRKSVDNFNNSLLHIVGSLSPSLQFNHIRDAALQMQRELQWLKEVERFVSPSLHELVNRVDNKIGRELFTKNHKELVKEGEKSMKETATSCTVVGALIITIMFSAAFTVAGGNNQNTGLPMFLDDRLFMVFIVSDALSLFASTTSVMIFLGILTSRYAEDDFLTSLPTKMMIGLLTLFFSIATMMVAFSTTLIIMLHDKYSWIIVPVVSLACIPITTFVWMQFPLLKEICVSTYGSGIFDKRCSPSLRHGEDVLCKDGRKSCESISLTSKNKV